MVCAVLLRPRRGGAGGGAAMGGNYHQGQEEDYGLLEQWIYYQSPNRIILFIAMLLYFITYVMYSMYL